MLFVRTMPPPSSAIRASRHQFCARSISSHVPS
jgi:hypothetical protein